MAPATSPRRMFVPRVRSIDGRIVRPDRRYGQPAGAAGPPASAAPQPALARCSGPAAASGRRAPARTRSGTRGPAATARSAGRHPTAGTRAGTPAQQPAVQLARCRPSRRGPPRTRGRSSRRCSPRDRGRARPAPGWCPRRRTGRRAARRQPPRARDAGGGATPASAMSISSSAGSPNDQRAAQWPKAQTIGSSSRPAGVRRYSVVRPLRPPFAPGSPAARAPAGARAGVTGSSCPGPRWISLNRRQPSISSRRMSGVQRSPKTSAPTAMGQYSL